ncbi:hypothetical protein [uncultured Robinsoniella sp.]|uniref:hypothetical protein n=1 Tax=uncultured Robinsoniella sp. TaxID=904190 RepID=UPI00374EFD63
MLQLVVNRNLKTQEERNIGEIIEIAMCEKEEQFKKMLDRTCYLTSDTGWSGTVKLYRCGYYIELEGTRSVFKCFLDNCNNVIRKPRNIEIEQKYSISGNNTEIHHIRFCK